MTGGMSLPMFCRIVGSPKDIALPKAATALDSLIKASFKLQRAY